MAFQRRRVHSQEMKCEETLVCSSDDEEYMYSNTNTNTNVMIGGGGVGGGVDDDTRKENGSVRTKIYNRRPSMMFMSKKAVGRLYPRSKSLDNISSTLDYLTSTDDDTTSNCAAGADAAGAGADTSGSNARNSIKNNRNNNKIINNLQDTMNSKLIMNFTQRFAALRGQPVTIVDSTIWNEQMNPSRIQLQQFQQQSQPQQQQQQQQPQQDQQLVDISSTNTIGVVGSFQIFNHTTSSTNRVTIIPYHHDQFYITTIVYTNNNCIGTRNQQGIVNQEEEKVEKKAVEPLSNATRIRINELQMLLNQSALSGTALQITSQNDVVLQLCSTIRGSIGTEDSTSSSMTTKSLFASKKRRSRRNKTGTMGASTSSAGSSSSNTCSSSCINFDEFSILLDNFLTTANRINHVLVSSSLESTTG